MRDGDVAAPTSAVVAPAARPCRRPASRRRPPLRRLALALGLLLTAGAAAPPRAAAQDAPVDTAAVLLDLATHLEAEGRLEQARLLYGLIRERYPGSPAANAAALRLASAPRARRSGRTELLVWSTLYGLWLGGATPASFGAEDPEPYGLGLLVGGPVGFLAARAYARGHDVTEGHARAITFGGTWGTWQGFGWREVFDLGDETVCSGDVCYTDESGPDAVFAAMVVGGLAGITAGGLVANAHDVRAGTATAVNFGALWGTWYGVVAGVLADLDDGEEDGVLAAALVGGDAGLLAIALLAPGWNVSVERARLVSIAGVAGGLAGAGLDLLIQPEDEDVAILIPALTSALGLVLGVGWTRGRDDADAGGANADAAASGALLELRDGRWSLGMPLPRPALLHAGEPGHTRATPALHVELLHARF